MTTLERDLTGVDDERWHAVLNHDGDADGSFVYAVRSTGVYCRPSCPARRPARAMVAFFAAPAQAAVAGFRPCRRCRPDQAPKVDQLIAALRGRLDDGDAAGSIAELASEIGASPSHLQRVFKKATGLTPRQYGRQARLARFKGALRKGESVTGAIYDAGFGSSRALYDGASEGLGMKPSVYRDGGKGVGIAIGVIDTALGPLLVAASCYGVCSVRFGESDALEAQLRDEFPKATIAQDVDAVAPYVAAVRALLAGQPPGEVSIDAHGTLFQRLVWAALTAIPPGETRSYGEVAASVGRPGAARAVASACAANPLALLVPCHRVVGKDGALSGYRWGIERKKALLESEKATRLSRPGLS